jgi:protein TonB
MAQAIDYGGGGRLRSLLGVAIVHALLGAALIFGLRAETARTLSDPLKLINILADAPPPPPPPPPPPVLEQPPVKTLKLAPEGAPSPPSLKAEASPVVVPPPDVKLEMRRVIIIVPVPGMGAAVAAGTGDSPGAGTGTGGQEFGTGAGGQGAGRGGDADGPATRTRRIEGSFTSRDYPREASRAGIEGTTVARLTIGTDGRVSQCVVRASSGSEPLDRATCGIILQRFRFEPARDSRGEVTTDTVEWEQNWTLRRAGPEVADAQCRVQADKIADRRTARAEYFSCMAAAGWSRR